MKCPNCGSDNLESNLFCGHCGATIDEATKRLHEQVRDLIRQEVRDEAALAVRVADSAEERLWRWFKVLGYALTFAAVGLAAFGVTSFETAKKQIENAASSASRDLNSTSEVTKKTMEQRSSETISQIGRAGQDTIAQMQREGEETRKATNSVSLRLKASGTKMADIERQQDVQIGTLAKIRAESPDTPIGDISNDLFKHLGNGEGGNDPCNTLIPPSYCSKMLGSSPFQSLAYFPYKEGIMGDGVSEIQSRLIALGCYSGPSTGYFDSATTQAVIAFVATNGRPQKNSFELASLSPNAPTALLVDDSSGTVDHDMWGWMFLTTAKNCSTVVPQ
jgi:hypothetical protein